MKEDESLCKVETRNGVLYLFVQWLGDELTEFEVTISDGSLIWRANVTDEMMQDMAKRVEMNTKEYTSQCFNALTANLSGNDTFIYEANPNGSNLEFNWKKQLDDGVKFQLGSLSLSLSEENKVLMKKILDFSIQKVHEYKDKITNMKYEMDQLQRDRDNAILHLDKSIAGKEEMEVDLFQKFVTVLNSKKAKIRRLQETIEQQANAPITTAQSNTVSNTVEDHTTNEQARDDDTDVEMDDSQIDKGKNEEVTTTTSNIGSCLFKDEEDSAPVVKRRRKQPSRKPVRTPSKPVLPEVKTSITRTTSNASSTSTNSNESKQSTSGRTRRSRRNKDSSTFPDDVEDLFGDMA